MGVYAKADNLKIEKDGFLHLRFDRWSLKEGVNPHDTTLAPDETVIIDISEGSYPYTEFEKDINIKREETACVIVTLEGEKFSGNVYFENPYLTDFEDKNLLPEFERGSLGLSKFAWLGQNLTKREWPHFIISVNGKIVFDGEVFFA